MLRSRFIRHPQSMISSSHRIAAVRCLTLSVPLLLGSALARSPGLLAYLKSGQVWVQPDGQAARVLPGSAGALLLDISADGTLAFLSGPPGTRLDTDRVPPLKLFLSQPGYTHSTPLNAVVRGAPGTVAARWLAWQGEVLLAGTDQGTVGWNVAARRVLGPAQVPALASVSASGEVTAVSGTVASSAQPGVLLYGPGARPGTEVFDWQRPEPLLRALEQSAGSVKDVRRTLDPRVWKDAVNWAGTAPQVTRDGTRVYFASNVGTGLGTAGETLSVVFRTDVTDLKVQALDWLGVLRGSVQEVTPSPDGRRLLIVMTRQRSGQPDSLLYVADLGSRSVRELAHSTAPAGRLTLLDSACWLADSRRVALSVAYPTLQELTAKSSAVVSPPSALIVRDVTGRQLGPRVPGVTSVTCAPS